MLIRQLPPDSRTIASLQGGEQFLGWDADRYLLAALVDAVRENTYAFVSANSKKKPKQPEPVTRPNKAGRSHQKKNNQFAAMAAAHIAASRKAKGG